MILQEWIVSRLESCLDYERVLIQDPLRLPSTAEARVDHLAAQAGFTVIRASTNLAFRFIFENVQQDAEVKRIMLIDQTPLERLRNRNMSTAPPLFYPDFLALVPPSARIKLDLYQYLRDVTGDAGWPQACNEPRHARLIIPNIEAVLTAYRNLRQIDSTRFRDSDFETIVAFAALGMPEAAFKKLGAEEYWRIGLMGHHLIDELQRLAPNIVGPIRENLRQAPPPFCWFADRDPEEVVNGFYLAVILAQHSPQWRLLLANIDPGLVSFQKIDQTILQDDAPRLVSMDPARADRDLLNLEMSLDREQLDYILIQHLHIDQPEGFASLLENENYSSLFRSLALFLAIDNLFSDKPSTKCQHRVQKVLFPSGDRAVQRLVEQRVSPSWSALLEIYRLFWEIEPRRRELQAFLKTVSVKKADQLDFADFWERWTKKSLGRLEYLLSLLERQVNSAELLPRKVKELPENWDELRERLRERVRVYSERALHSIDSLNLKFQELVKQQFPSWVKREIEAGNGPVLTSRFLETCLQPYWDVRKEKAVLFIFDGMRYDIWDLFLRDTLSDCMEIIEERPGCALLPSETHLSRKAISAGDFPDSFNTAAGEDKLLQGALKKLYHQDLPVEVVAPEGSGTGETVHYRWDNLDVYIFELCDTELHGIKVKKIAPGREVPARPLAVIYQQVKNIIDHEIMAIVRNLSPGTRVFITADHGFAWVGRKDIWFDSSDLHVPYDCTYLNCLLKSPYEELQLPAAIKKNIIAFTPHQLHIAARETRFNKTSGEMEEQLFETVAFPRTGFSFRRPAAPYHPDAFSHGGISLQELLIPMVVLQVKDPEQGLLNLSLIEGPSEVLEGENIELSARLDYASAPQLFPDDLRVELRAYYAADAERFSLPGQILYIGGTGGKVSYRFQPDAGDASVEECRSGYMQRVFTLEISYRDGQRMVRKTRSHRFVLKLNAEKVMRQVPSHLGNILGLTPKSMR